MKRWILMVVFLAGCERGGFYDRDDVPAQWRQCYEPMGCHFYRCIKREWFVAGECQSWEADAACYPCPRGQP